MVAEPTRCSEALTNDVRVFVVSRYAAEHSDPRKLRYVFAYRVAVTNERDEPIRLLTRHWTIKDARGEVQEVEGVGVIGKTPVIAPGETHTYESFCPLSTEFGTMEGFYGMVNRQGRPFQARVAPFQLLRPLAVN